MNTCMYVSLDAKSNYLPIVDDWLHMIKKYYLLVFIFCSKAYLFYLSSCSYDYLFLLSLISAIYIMYHAHTCILEAENYFWVLLLKICLCIWTKINSKSEKLIAEIRMWFTNKLHARKSSTSMYSRYSLAILILKFWTTRKKLLISSRNVCIESYTPTAQTLHFIYKNFNFWIQ